MKGNGQMELMFGGAATSMYNEKSLTDLEKEAALDTHNKAIKAQEERLRKNTEEALAKANEMRAKAEAMDVRPINQYVLVKPYKKNPFELMETTESGLIIPEHNINFRNPDSGEMDEEINLSVVADVLEVSPLCKFCKPGDMVYYRRAQGVPVPFLRQGLEVVPEPCIQVVVNDKDELMQRFANL